MKAFSPLPALLCSLLAPFAAQAASPTVSGAWTNLRLAPVFSAEQRPLAKTWGPALPVGNAFQVEKSYGRWLYGTPAPLKRMKAKDFAAPGWVFSRMLLAPGDSDTLSPSLVRQAQAVIFHSQHVWKTLGLGQPPLVSPLDFLEGLTLSRGTLTAFQRQDETAPLAGFFPATLLPNFLWQSWPLAQAADEPAVAPMGLVGTDLSFLDQEFERIQDEKKVAERKRVALLLKPPGTPKLDTAIRTAILGRFMLQKYLELPPLTHEEVDGFIYMRATAMRALEGCPKEIRDYWKNRRWNLMRVFRMHSRPEVRHPWLEVSLPGGYFAVSARAIELAGNEAELAFLLVRPLVREPRIQRKITLSAKNWPQSLQAASEEAWSKVLQAQSTKDSVNLDVSDEIAVDIAAVECISRGGYRPMAALSYLRKLSTKQEEPWAKWFFDNAIGLDFRLERLAVRLDDALAQQKFPVGISTNPKRFTTASRHWNLLP